MDRKIPPPRFAIKDTVSERASTGEAGTVVNIYEYEGDYRYVVHFHDGRESVFYEKQLTQHD